MCLTAAAFIASVRLWTPVSLAFLLLWPSAASQLGPLEHVLEQLPGHHTGASPRDFGGRRAAVLMPDRPRQVANRSGSLGTSNSTATLAPFSGASNIPLPLQLNRWQPWMLGLGADTAESMPIPWYVLFISGAVAGTCIFVVLRSHLQDVDKPPPGRQQNSEAAQVYQIWPPRLPSTTPQGSQGRLPSSAAPVSHRSFSLGLPSPSTTSVPATMPCNLVQHQRDAPRLASAPAMTNLASSGVAQPIAQSGSSPGTAAEIAALGAEVAELEAGTAEHRGRGALRPRASKLFPRASGLIERMLGEAREARGSSGAAYGEGRAPS